LQCWSETMILQPAIEGMAGIEPNALTGELFLSPHFPWDWNSAEVSNIRMKDTKISLKMENSPDQTTFTMNKTGDLIKLSFAPSFPFFTDITSVEINGSPVSFNILNQSESIRLILDQINFIDDKITVSIRHHGGIALLPSILSPAPGEESSGIRVLYQKRMGSQLVAVVEGKPGKTYQLRLFSSGTVKGISGGTITGNSGSIYTFETQLPPSGEKYVTKELTINE